MGGTEFTNDYTNSSNPTWYTNFWDGSTDDLSGSAISYIFENGWNDTFANGTLSASGGGVSTKFTKPDWQSGAGVPDDGQRDVPDISFTSSPDHDGYLVCSQSSCAQGFRQSDQSFFVIGGTSAASPAFAGVVALLNQKFSQSQGNINPALYTQAANYSWVFHDIVVGSNAVSCQQGTPDCPATGTIGYECGTGYDPVTGLGSMDVMAFINAVNGTPEPDFWISLYPDRTAQLTVGPFVSLAATLYPLQGFNGSADLSCSVPPTLVGLQCTLSEPSISLLQGSYVQFQLTGGNQSGEVRGIAILTATSGSLTHQLPILVIADYPDFQISADVLGLSLSSGGSGNSTITIASVNGTFSSTVDLTCSVSSGLGATTCSLSPTSLSGTGTSTLTVHAATLAAKLDKSFPLSPRGMGLESSLLFAAVLLIPGKRPTLRRTKRDLWTRVVGLLAISLLALTVSCGGGSSNSNNGGGPPVHKSLSGTVTVQGTSGSLNHTVQLPVLVN